MSGNPPLSGLSRLLNEELALLSDFVSALKREQEALVGGKIDLLKALLEEKDRLAAELGQRIDSRNQTLSAAGLETDKAGMEVWLTGQPKPAREDWHAILTLAKEARLLNDINGNLINTRMQQNQQALAVLQSASNRTMLYGPDGQQLSSGGGRHLGAA